METKICECGLLISSLSKNGLKTNMKNHKAGKKHKRFMQIKRENSKK